ncbi:hypothetical protein QQS21_007782 [Conoideocrella luteorostrata]|uniref:Uncharacterized protein n=1 Tax=Conoideocrella luteorostrata TaxID=1105319 RepID=A0AAJ0CPF4_9HYPO|nr:hypothetical protein QQS21_007782 [Conoideocrella luteorostrata]
MTVFWLNYLQYAMTSYAQHRYLGTLPSREDFAEVLLHTPDVMDSGLWKRYYGRELMLFNPRARESWVSPDIQALPCSVNSIQSGELLEDASQMESSLLIKFALKIVQSTSSTNLRRGAIIKQSLSPLQTSIIRMRASKPTIPPYSDTKAYFWIQFVHAAYEALQPASAKDVSRTTGWHGHMNTLTFPAFQALFDVAGDEWRSYYSQPLWDSIEARIKFVSPDKRRLPNLISMPPLPAESKSHAPMVRKSSLGISMTKKMPSPASLSVMVAAVCDAAALSESDSPDPDVKTHADLIVFLYDTLVAQIPTGPVSDDSLAAMTKRRRDLRRRVDEALRVSGPSVEGATHKMFWIQQVLVAAEQVEGSCSSIDSFMNSNPHLAYKGLPLMYYSERALRSRQAMEVYVPPDRRALPNGSRGLVMLED